MSIVTAGQYAGRAKQAWWAVVDGRVRRVVGYSCDGSDYWWCPEVGLSMCAGVHLFATRADAVARCREELLDARSKIDRQLAALDREEQGRG